MQEFLSCDADSRFQPGNFRAYLSGPRPIDLSGNTSYCGEKMIVNQTGQGKVDSKPSPSPA
jgi:hypothetical protein